MLIVLFVCSGTVHSQKNVTEKSVKSALVDSFAEFVDSVSMFYSQGDTYIEFKKKVLLGSPTQQAKTTLPMLPPQGDNLLKRAYYYLSKGLGSGGVINNNDYQTFGEAILYIHNFKKRNKSDYQTAEVALFGGDPSHLTNNELLKSTKGKCKCWQLWCHLGEIFGEDMGNAIIEAIVIAIINML